MRPFVVLNLTQNLYVGFFDTENDARLCAVSSARRYPNFTYGIYKAVGTYTLNTSTTPLVEENYGNP